MVGADGNAPRALTSVPLGTVLQTAVRGNPLKLLVDRRGVEPRTPPCKGGVFPSIPTAQLF